MPLPRPPLRPALRPLRLLHTPIRRRFLSTEPCLKETLRSAIPAKLALLKSVKAHADKPIGTLSVANVIGGMRGLTALVWEGSKLDPDTGIRFHGRSIAECQAVLPKGRTGAQMLPEAMFWYLLTGAVPTTAQTRAFSAELAQRAAVPSYTTALIAGLPRDMHPMTAFSMAVASLSHGSEFARAYAAGLDKRAYWEYVLDDVVDLVAKLPTLAALIYAHSYGAGVDSVPAADPQEDWGYNFARMLGRGGPEHEGFQDLVRLYLALHGDHEGGNVSAHATHLVGSALSDAYLSYSAGLAGLAGPLHGLAAQEVLRWILQMQAAIPASYTDADISAYLWTTLKSGRVIPGFGHAVLRQPDPRFSALMDFAASQPAIRDDPVFRLVAANARIAPDVLREHGKTKNPFPNVDSSSGVLFHHYGFKETLYYTATFGVSRGLGPLAQLVWDRILGLPIERPKSITLSGLLEAVEGR